MPAPPSSDAQRPGALRCTCAKSGCVACTPLVALPGRQRSTSLAFRRTRVATWSAAPYALSCCFRALAFAGGCASSAELASVPQVGVPLLPYAPARHAFRVHPRRKVLASLGHCSGASELRTAHTTVQAATCSALSISNWPARRRTIPQPAQRPCGFSPLQWHASPALLHAVLARRRPFVHVPIPGYPSFAAEAPETERKAGPLSRGGTLAGSRALGVVPSDAALAAAGMSMGMMMQPGGKFTDPRWIDGNWDMNLFKDASGEVNWDAVIDAEATRRRYLEAFPEVSTLEDEVKFDTNMVPWWAWVRRFHLPEAEKINGRAAMLGFASSYLVDALTHAGVVAQTDSFFGKIFMWTVFFGCAFVRNVKDLDGYKGAQPAAPRLPPSVLLRRCPPHGPCLKSLASRVLPKTDCCQYL